MCNRVFYEYSQIYGLGEGAPRDFDERADEIKGKIVLTTSEVHPKGIRRWVHRNEKVGRALLAGATGFIFANHYPFLMAGVPTGGIGSIRATFAGRGYGHTRYDTLDKVEMRSLREAAALASRLALRMASAAEWPAKRRSQETVKALLDSPDYREEAELFASVDAFYKAARSKE